MIIHYIITAWRCIMKFKTQNIIAVLGLSVALFCFSICLYVTRYIYNTNECFENRERIVQLTTQDLENGNVSGYTFCDFSEDLKKYGLSEIDTYAYVNFADERTHNIEVSEGKMLPYTLLTSEIDTSYNRVFTPKVLFGSWEQAAHVPNSILLSESTAKRIFGKAEVAIGKQMVLTHKLMTSPDTTPHTGGIAYTIQGVLEDLPINNSLNFLRNVEAWVLNDSEGILNCSFKHSMASGNTYALLKEGISREDFCRKLNERKLEVNYFQRNEQIVSFAFDELFWKDSMAPYFAIISLIAGVLMLLVGMLNFFHFLTGSFITRIREYSLRRVSGARAWQLWSMLLVQATLLLLVSALFTMMLMEITSPFLSFDIISITIDRNLMMQQAGGYLFALWVCCMLAAAIVVWKVKRIDIQRGLFGGGGVYGKHRLRNVLLGIQLFICWIFVSLTLMLYLQSQKSSETLLGTFTSEEKEEIYSIPLWEYTFLSQEERMDLIAALGKVPGVKALLPTEEGFASGVTATSIFTQPERNRDHVKQTTIIYTHPNFFEFMNIPILAGVPSKNNNEMVISKGFEEMMEKEMLGQMLYDWDENAFVVTGVCQSLMQSLKKLQGRYNQDICIFKPLTDEDTYHCYVKCESGQKKQVGEGLGNVLRERLPENVEICLNTLMDDIKQAQSMEFELRGITGFFAIVTLIIVLLGVYAAITLDTEYRRKEMAIRKVNGAGVKQIAFIFARLYIWLLTVTAVLAFPIVAFAVREFSASYAVFAEIGFGFYGSIFLGITAIITLTVAFRIYLITKVSPAEIIRKE